ncbi:MAG: cupin domain-containing protein [Pseudomonadota bacterium]
MKPLINLADAPSGGGYHGDQFEYRMAELARPLAAKKIGANVTRVPPGKAAFPHHHHRANEEHFFVLGGTGILRLGSETYSVRPHDYIVIPPGGPELAHQLINTGTEDLSYLAISTMELPEVVGYPDSGKTGVRTTYSDDPGARFLVQDDAKDRVTYWEGETGEAVDAAVAADRRP